MYELIMRIVAALKTTKLSEELMVFKKEHRRVKTVRAQHSLLHTHGDSTDMLLNHLY